MMARLGTWKAYPKLPDKKGPKLSRQERALKKKNHPRQQKPTRRATEHTHARLASAAEEK